MNADEIRDLVERAQKRGLIGGAPKSDASRPVPVDKAGLDVMQFLGKAQCKWVDVTPAKAEDWLKNNFANRPVKEDVVISYARDMIAGLWVPTHQGIAFNDQDHLIDGQHRLLAVVMSGVTVRMMVTFGLPSRIEGREMTTMDCVDRGRTRSVADQLSIQHGFKNANITAAICGSLASLCCGERTRRLGVGHVLDVFRAFEQPVQFVIEHRSKNPGLKAAGVLAGFAFALAEKPEVGKLFELMNSGAELLGATALRVRLDGGGTARPIEHLRAFLTSDEAKLFSRSLDRGLAELVLEALRMELAGAAITKLELGQDGVNYFRVCQPARVEKIAALFKLPARIEPARPEPKPEPAPAPAAPAPKAKRPSMEVIVANAELHFQIARIILLGRGNDADLATARIVIVTVARACGYTDEQIAPVLRRTPEQVAALDVGLDALTSKQRKAVETLKRRLGL